MEHIETLFQAIGYYVLIGIALGIVLVFVATWVDFIFSCGVSFITDGDVKPKSYIAEGLFGLDDWFIMACWASCYALGGVLVGALLDMVLALSGHPKHPTPHLPTLGFIGGAVVYIGIPSIFMLLLRGIYRGFKNMLKAHSSAPNAHK